MKFSDGSEITDSFIGGNIKVVRTDGDSIFLACDLRDSDDWFYWAFLAKGFGGRTVHFSFSDKNWVGYFGPAVSHDNDKYVWQGSRDGANGFTYTFGKDENEVYFAHHILYHPESFYRFAKSHGLEVKTFCKSEKGRDVPFTEFGDGNKKIILTGRHHCCESTGNYVLEGVLDGLYNNLPDGYGVLCVPFMDFDGVMDGDQGKGRKPHDHNRDYTESPIYASVRTLMDYCTHHETPLGFDFHSPYHAGGENDWMYIVQKSIEKKTHLDLFGEIFEECMTDGAFQYRHEHDHQPNVGWNQIGSPTCSTFTMALPSNDIAFSLETAYFGEKDNVFTPQRAFESGRCFAEAIRRYVEKMKE